MNLLGKIVQRYSLDAYYNDAAFSFNGVPYMVYGGTSPGENAPSSFVGYTKTLYKQNGTVFACIQLRSQVFSEARFQWQGLTNGNPGDLFGTAELAILERPWPNGTTGELLARLEQDTSIAGNAYIIREGIPGDPNTDRLRRLRPDWVEIVLSAPAEQAVSSDVVGYRYYPGGKNSSADPVTYLPGELAHWSPIPDPEAQYRGMSWLTPVLREAMSDKAMTDHKQSFLDNAATPQLAVTVPPEMPQEEFEEFMEMIDRRHAGTSNAYKTLYLGGGATASVVGKDLKELDFKEVQGAGEVRICVAARVPPVLLGISEGLKGSALNAGNYTAARRGFASGTMRPQWRSACAALEVLLAKPRSSVRLWYDDRDIDFLNEDRTDLATVQQSQAATVSSLIASGFDPVSVVKAVMASDMNLLKHSGMYSVQLWAPGQDSPSQPQGSTPAPADDPADGPDDKAAA